METAVGEKAVVMVEAPNRGHRGAPEVKDTSRFKCWGPEEAKARFLERFGELIKLTRA